MPFPSEIDGVPVANYYDWAKVTWTFSITGLPALSVPCGKSEPFREARLAAARPAPPRKAPAPRPSGRGLVGPGRERGSAAPRGP